MSQKFPDHNEIVVCLYDGNYHYGVGALANSLTKQGFKGIIFIAYRDILPPWANQLKLIEKNIYQLTNDIILYFELINTDIHLAYFKPYFIKQALNTFPAATKFYYFDTDIVITAPWDFFSHWLENEVCLCLDNSFEFVHKNHPWRKDWRKLYGDNGTHINSLNFYVNSGFIAISKRNSFLIDKWIELTELYEKAEGNLKIITQDGHNSFKGDQDLLNAAITLSPDIELSVIGKEGMGFTQPAYLMAHAISKHKPWAKNYLQYLIRNGSKPNHSEKVFFNYCKQPIRLFSGIKYFLKKSNLIMATFLGRYIGY